MFNPPLAPGLEEHFWCLLCWVFQGLHGVVSLISWVSEKSSILILVPVPPAGTLTVVLVKFAPVLHPLQVSKPWLKYLCIRTKKQQSCISNEFTKHLHFHGNLMLFHLIKDCTWFPQSLTSQSITDTLWNIWNPLESPWDHCWIPQPFNICNYTEIHRNYCLFFTGFSASSVEDIFCTKWRILILTHKTLCSFCQ